MRTAPFEKRVGARRIPARLEITDVHDEGERRLVHALDHPHEMRFLALVVGRVAHDGEGEGRGRTRLRGAARDEQRGER